jgi:hypothetical protein
MRTRSAVPVSEEYTAMKGYRSHIVNGLAMTAAILMMPGMGDVIPPSYIKFVPLVQGAIAIIMRQLTTTPPGQAGPSTPTQ